MLTQPFAIPAAFFFLVAIPLVAGLIPRNRFYGVRTRKSLTEDRIWYPVNRFAGIMLMLASLVYALVAACWPYNKPAGDNFTVWLVHLIGFVLPLFIGLVLTFIYARRL
jgi:uncharacterized membrane protein